MPDALKPCPWCGGPAEMCFGSDWYVRCSNKRCGTNPNTHDYRTERSARAAWNKRTDPPKTTEPHVCGTGKEWVALYRAATGACPAGSQAFVSSNKINLDATYTAQQVAELTAGAFGNDKFRAALTGGES